VALSPRTWTPCPDSYLALSHAPSPSHPPGPGRHRGVLGQRRTCHPRSRAKVSGSHRPGARAPYDARNTGSWHVGLVVPRTPNGRQRRLALVYGGCPQAGPEPEARLIRASRDGDDCRDGQRRLAQPRRPAGGWPERMARGGWGVVPEVKHSVSSFPGRRLLVRRVNMVRKDPGCDQHRRGEVRTAVGCGVAARAAGRAAGPGSCRVTESRKWASGRSVKFDERRALGGPAGSAAARRAVPPAAAGARCESGLVEPSAST